MVQDLKKVRSPRWLWITLPLAVLVWILLSTWKVNEISGQVSDENGEPIAGATVRLRTTDYAVKSDAGGRYILSGFPPALKVRVTAWADGYYINGRNVWPWDEIVDLPLTSYLMEDNPEYDWGLPAIEGRSFWENLGNWIRLTPAAIIGAEAFFFHTADNLNLGCRDCHGKLIYEEWISSVHALGFSNPLFASMYLGTDLDGNQSPETRYLSRQDYGGIPLAPDPEVPYYGPGYKLDFPDSAGNCASCHLPAAALDDPLGTDSAQVIGVNEFGSHCDFCHKIVDVKIDPSTGLPAENMPGVLSMEMMRPQPHTQLFLGPYDDVDAGTDSYLPLQQESQFCAACHNASFWGVPIYESFAEWLASPYSDPESGQTCQDCHMKPGGLTTNFAPGRGGQERPAHTIPSHEFPGASSVNLLQNTADLAVAVIQKNGYLQVDVRVTNSQAGHHIPTDSPLRQIFLLVSAVDSSGSPLSLQEGTVLPDWAGNLAGEPGRYYAKILEQLWSEESPTGAYWTQTRIIEDTRIKALQSDSSSFIFALQDGKDATVEVELLFRRAFYEMAQQKKWDIPDILMATKKVEFSKGDN